MYDFQGIVSRNNRTFYDYSTGERVPIWPRIGLQVLIAAALAIISADDIGNFLNGILATQAILTGFSFTLLFYLMSADASELHHDPLSLEHKVRVRRVKALSRELFDNISYYSMISLASVVIATMLLAPNPKPKIDAMVSWFVGLFPDKIINIADVASPYVNIGVSFIYTSAVCILYFSIIESFYSFFRNIDRVNFLFKERISIASPEDD